jgi:NAD(P)-dependent dehydrogenase (short-subunit alcohol dehydrogenase family)
MGMSKLNYSTALIIGAGAGISASLARALAREGLKVSLAARNPAKLAELAAQTGASVHSVDAAKPEAMAQLFAASKAQWANWTSSSITRVRECRDQWRSWIPPSCGMQLRLLRLAASWPYSRLRGG